MAQALGAKLLDQNNHQISFGGGNLDKLDRIDISNLDSRLQDVKIILASDITNPLIGKDGASRVLDRKKALHQKWLKNLKIIYNTTLKSLNVI